MNPDLQDDLEAKSQRIRIIRANLADNQPASHRVEIDRRLSSCSNVVFPVDDVAFPAVMPRPSHWSVVWSDLMMTMFILFLVMYAYQQGNEQFLEKKKPEVIGGDTTEALQTVDSSGAVMPFSPIRKGPPLMTAGKIKQVVPVHDVMSQKDGASSKKGASPGEGVKDLPTPLAATSIPAPGEAEVADAQPMAPDQKAAAAGDNFQEMYTLSKDALDSNNLNRFASIDIVPDKTMRIILTGDLLFDVGQSDISGSARNSLVKVASAIRNTPYMINVVGHTDNTPMRSNRFNSNWELSLARASTVARYLIEEIGMDPNQFVVSGYSSFRPVEPNTTADNRAKNRRVEIIISKRLPPPVPATRDNLN
jgi:chemotaxis protein MotB